MDLDRCIKCFVICESNVTLQMEILIVSRSLLGKHTVYICMKFSCIFFVDHALKIYNAGADV